MTVTLNDTDITDYIQGNSFTLTSIKAEVGQVLINPVPTLVGIDTSGFWNPNNPASVFFGVNDYSVYKIKILDNNLEIFSGSIQNISRSPGGLANVELQSELQTLLNKNIIYSSGSGLNPAQVFIEICQLYEIEFDPVSTQRSSGIYDTDSITVSCNLLSPDNTIISIFEVLSQTGVASIYSVGNTLYYSVYEGGSIINPIVNLVNTSDSDSYYLLSKPTITTVQKDVPSGYSISYKGVLSENDLVTTFGLQTNAFSISGGSGDLITIDTLQSATWIGEQWLEYLSRADTEISLEILTSIARDLQLGYPIRLEMNDNTRPLNMKVKELTFNNRIETNLKGIAYD